MSTTKPRRILVVANETVQSPVLHEAIYSCAGRDPKVSVLVLAPALNSRLRHWTCDDDDARKQARQRLVDAVERLGGDGLEVDGIVGDADPLVAIEDALRFYPADRLIVATHPESRSNWLARRLVERARERFDLPILHIVATSERQRAANWTRAAA